MKRKRITAVILSVITAASAAALSACGNSSKDSSGQEPVNPNMTQLYVRNYQGGFGSKWLYNGKEKFEELYKDVSFEEGKTGLQIMITEKKETPEISNIKNDVYDVYFVEKVQYLYLKNQGVVADMTDIVTSTNKYEEKTIESKLSDEQKEFYGVKDENGKVHYYALPHYMAAQGIVYDIDLFEERGYYFADGYENESELFDKFIVDAEDKRSAGPDGEYRTDDDGLPATYADFWDLCEYIAQDNRTPLNWGSKTGQYYITALLNQLIADYQGKDQYMLNATFDGVMNDLVKIENGTVVKDGDGNPVTESVSLDPSRNNGYETYRSAGYYYALDFVRTLVKNIERYTVAENINTQSYTAFDAQDDYIMSRHATNMKRQAMLIEGTWWDSEATDAFTDMVTVYGSKGAKENCRYGWMPLPKANRKKVEEKVGNTMVNTIDSLCFVKAGLADWREALAFDFVQFMNTDEAFKDFTLMTNAFKDFNYTLDADEIGRLSPFGRKLYEQWKSYDIINPHNNNEQYYSTTYMISSSRRYAISASAEDTFPNMVFAARPNVSVDDYFVATNNYVRTAIWTNAPKV